MNTLRGVFPEPPHVPRRNFIRENMIHIKRMQGLSEDRVDSNRRVRTNVVEADTPHQQRTMKLIQSTRKQLQELQRQSNMASEKPIKLSISASQRTVPTRSKKRHAHKNIFNTSKTAVESLNENMHKMKFRDTGMQTENYRNMHQLYEQGTIVYPSDNVITVLTHKKTSPRPRTDEPRSLLYGDGDISSGTPEPKPITEGKNHDYVKENAQVIKYSNAKHNQSMDPTMAPATYQKGVVPKYLRERKEEIHKQSRGDGDDKCPTGHVVLPENERRETLRMLRQSYAELVNELNMLPVRSDTLKIRNRKMEIENQLKKLDEGIKVFTRPTVYVKIGA